jgi:hypothetical protein
MQSTDAPAVTDTVRGTQAQAIVRAGMHWLWGISRREWRPPPRPENRALNRAGGAEKERPPRHVSSEPLRPRF